MAVSKLPVRSCLIDGEAIVCDEKGLAVFDLIRRRGPLASAVHCASDLLELDGRDLRREPIENPKRCLRSWSKARISASFSMRTSRKMARRIPRVQARLRGCCQ